MYSIVPILFLLSFAFEWSTPSAKRKTELIYQASNGTWFENLAVRRDGSILVTTLTSPTLYLIQPSAERPDPIQIHGFDGYETLTGITEEADVPDSFIVAACNFSIATFALAPNSSGLWRVRYPLRDHHPHSHTRGGEETSPTVTLLTRLPDVVLPNGLVTLNAHTVLLADSAKGNIVAIDTHTGASRVAVSDPLLETVNRPVNAVNRLKIHGDTLYFTNGQQNLLGRVQIDRETGAPKGPASVVARGLPGFPSTVAYDDFELDAQERFAYLTTSGGNAVNRVEIANGRQIILAGDLNSTDLAQPTAVKFGRGKEAGKVLYVTTGGGLAAPVNGNEVVGAQLVEIRIDDRPGQI